MLYRGLFGLSLVLGAYSAPVEQISLSSLETQHGAVASESSECTQIGIDLLKAGGNAADALVGTTLCVGTIGMYHSGIGGGGFALVRSAEGDFEHVDFRESAPALAHQDMYKNNTRGSIEGGLASAVPSEIRGLQYIHDTYGVLPWADVVTPAVNIARNGFRVSPDLIRYMGYVLASNKTFLIDDPNWAIDFAPTGRLVKLNETIYRRRYADTLEKIALFGPDIFYSGEMAQDMIATIQATGGVMTMADLQNYTVISRPAAQITYRDYVLSSCGVPAGGSVSLAMLKILEGFPDIGDPAQLNASTHCVTEAMRFAYAARSNLGDPAYLSDLSSYEEAMLSASTAAHIRSRITAQTHNMSYYNPSGIENPPAHGTSHIVAADASGLAITLTTTVNLLFGSQLIVPSTGVILNNEMNDFSIPGKSNAFGYIPSPANYIAPGKRPLSSIAPVIVEHAANRSLHFVVGAAGGSRIITSVMLALWNVLDRNMTTADALAEPRIHDQLAPDTAMVEWGFDNATVADLKSRGHNVTWVAPGLSAVQAIKVGMDGGFEAVGEPRQKNALGLVV